MQPVTRSNAPSPKVFFSRRQLVLLLLVEPSRVVIIIGLQVLMSLHLSCCIGSGGTVAARGELPRRIL